MQLKNNKLLSEEEKLHILMDRVSHKELVKTAQRVDQFFHHFDKRFVDRGDLTQMIKLGMVTKSHTLFYGEPGTSKSGFVNTLLNNMTYSQDFRIELNKFSKATDLFGGYDIPKYRETGDLEHKLKGTIAMADMAYVGEFFNAHQSLHGTLHATLNERELVRGIQVVNLPLHMAILDSNISPEDYLKVNANGWAIVDRIALIGHVPGIKDHGNMYRAMMKFQKGLHANNPMDVQLDYRDVLRLTAYVVYPDHLFTNPHLLQIYSQAAIEYRDRRLEEFENRRNEGNLEGAFFPNITDRRIILSSQMAEAFAVLYGRTHVEPADLVGGGHMLCSCKWEWELWMKVIEDHLKEIADLMKNKKDMMVHDELFNIKDQLEKIDVDGVESNPEVTSLLEAKKKLDALLDRMGFVQPTNIQLEDFKKTLIKSAKGMHDRLRDMSPKVLGFGINKFEEENDL
ncbi:MAG: AAA family ATPase [Bacteroidota bacterium]